MKLQSVAIGVMEDLDYARSKGYIPKDCKRLPYDAKKLLALDPKRTVLWIVNPHRFSITKAFLHLRFRKSQGELQHVVNFPKSQYHRCEFEGLPLYRDSVRMEYGENCIWCGKWRGRVTDEELYERPYLRVRTGND